MEKILYVASGKKSFDYLLKKWSDDITYLDMCGGKGVIKANMLDMPFKDNEFDLVWCDQACSFCQRMRTYDEQCAELDKNESETVLIRVNDSEETKEVPKEKFRKAYKKFYDEQIDRTKALQEIKRVGKHYMIITGCNIDLEGESSVKLNDIQIYSDLLDVE